MRCTGPYTRVQFDTHDAKAARALVDGLASLGLELTIRHLAQGKNGLEDFALDVDFRAAEPGQRWEVRAAKYLGPKKRFGQSFVLDAALRHRDAQGTILWEGYVFASSLKELGQTLTQTLPRVLAGEIPGNVFDRDDAELHRIEQCTGMS
ncbi:MAG TPA: hypothetical protein VIN57_04805 [Magnetovibrio sp.]